MPDKILDEDQISFNSIIEATEYSHDAHHNAVNHWRNREFSISSKQWSNSEYSSATSEHYYDTENTALVSKQSLVSYRRRWLTLFIFSMNTMVNGLLFMSLSPINNVAVRYYRVSPVRIEWLSNMFMLSYTFLALPSSYIMSKWGVRSVLTIASCLDFFATCFHFLGCNRDRFWLVLFGQVFAAIAYSMIIQIPGKLSSLWFPEKESATATSIGVFMNLLGVALGFLQPSLMVKDTTEIDVVHHGLTAFFLSQMILAGMVVVVTLAYKEKPPTPPTFSSLRETTCFATDLRLLIKNKHYVILAQSYGIYFGLFVTFSVLVSPLLTSKFPSGYESSLGWMGFWCDLAAIISCLVIGVLLDKFRAHYVIGVLLNLSSLLVWLAFILSYIFLHGFNLLYNLYILLGICGVPYFAAGIEQAAEMTYPASEELSSTVMLVLGNFYGFIFIIFLGELVQSGYNEIVGTVMVALYLLSTIFAIFAKTELKRWDASQQASLESETLSQKTKKNYSGILH